MADDWAILTGSVMIIIALGMIVFYLIPIQARELLKNKDWLTGLRWRLILASVSITIAASPVITNRLLRWLGVNSTLLANISVLSIGIAFLAFALALVSVYHYKKKE